MAPNITGRGEWEENGELEAARMGFGNDMKEYKVEFTLQNCPEDHDTCFNLESTEPSKQKGCGKLRTLVSDVSHSFLNASDLQIKQDECKKISGAVTQKVKKAMVIDDEGIKKREEQLEDYRDKAGEDQIKQIEETIARAKKFRLKTFCTCSEDGCNGGNQAEVKLFMPVITAFIISQIFGS